MQQFKSKYGVFHTIVFYIVAPLSHFELSGKRTNLNNYYNSGKSNTLKGLNSRFV